MEKRIIRGIFAALGILILILDSKTALQGGIAGIEVCLMQVIPALLPFFVLTMLLSSAFTGANIPMLRPLGRLCRMPRGSESLLLLGLLGGYPAGAQSVAEAYRSGQLQRQDAQRLLSFCSNAGPSFLFGFASVVFPYSWLPWVASSEGKQPSCPVICLGVRSESSPWPPPGPRLQGTGSDRMTGSSSQ